MDLFIAIKRRIIMGSVACNKRENSLDSIHGLLVLYMMLMHLLGFAIGTVSKYYYPLTHFLSFFMAWFYFKAGMFYRERTNVDCIKKASRRLLLPAIIYSLLGFLLYAILNKFKLDLSYELTSFYQSGAPHGNNPIWFLYSLFFVQVIYNAFRKIRISPYFIPLISAVLFAIPSFINVSCVLFLNVPLGLFFYSMGVVLSEKQYVRWLWIASLLGYVTLGLVPSVSDFRRGFYDPFWLGVLWSLLSCMAINGLFRRLPFLSVKPLRFIGRNAMIYYGTHWMIILLSQYAICVLDLGRTLSVICYLFFMFFYIILMTVVLNQTR